MFDLIFDFLPIGLLGIAVTVLTVWVGFKLIGGWIGLLAGAAIGLSVGLWLDNTTSPSVVRMRAFVYGLFFSGFAAFLLYSWLAPRH
jgi:hypothetical protein